MGVDSLSPPSPSTSCGMSRRPVQVVEQFLRSYTLRGLSDVFLFPGRPCEIRKRTVRTREKRGTSVHEFYSPKACTFLK